jgi:hypothetical protein
MRLQNIHEPDQKSRSESKSQVIREGRIALSIIFEVGETDALQFANHLNTFLKGLCRSLD